ncbi:MAG: ABC transporter permease [Salinibacterium sp.]|nr:ABC transporter permease [Salinibacterium sp.]
MSASTISPALGVAAVPPARGQLSFARVLRSEWIKFTTIRSTLWGVALAIVGGAGLAGLMSYAFLVGPSLDSTLTAAEMFSEIGDRPALAVIGFDIKLTYALVAILGVLLISTERASGLWNTTLVAVPSRTPALTAKLLLSGVAGTLLGFVAAVATVLITAPTFAHYGFEQSLFDPILAQVVVGAAVFTGLIGVMSTAVASVVRSTAAGAGIVLGLFLIVPSILGLVPGEFASRLAQLLPSAAGIMLLKPVDAVGWSTLATGFLVFLGWVVASVALALVLLKRKDV